MNRQRCSGRPAKRYSQATRLHDVIRLIEARHGITLEELAEETGVTRRTLHRDLAAIQEAGYPLISEWQGSCKVYRFLTRFKDVPPISFTLAELLTIHLAAAQRHLLPGTPFAADLEAILGKINSVLPPKAAAHLERIARVSLPLVQGVHDYAPVTAELRRLQEALIFQRRVRLAYRPRGEQQERSYEVDPYSLVLHRGGLYLLGYAHNRGAVRTFAAERLRGVELLAERFELPESYRPEEQFRQAFGLVEEASQAVRVRFRGAAAQTVPERCWHPSQRLELLADGSVELAFTAGGKREIFAWLLAFGPDAELLDPCEWRRELAAVAAAMAVTYAGGCVDNGGGHGL